MMKAYVEQQKVERLIFNLWDEYFKKAMDMKENGDSAAAALAVCDNLTKIYKEVTNMPVEVI